MLSQYKLKDYNFKLVFALIILSTLGVMLVNSADSSLRNRQLAGVIAGVIIMVILSLVDYSWILNFYKIIYIVNLVILVLVLITGTAKNGASRWIEFGGMQFQPTEISKIFLILFFSMYLMLHEEILNTFPSLVRSAGLLAIPLFLIISQPDLKNTITIAFIVFLLFYVAGLSYKTIFQFLLAVIVIGGVALLLITRTNLPIVKDYQRDRIMTYFNPEDEEYSEDAIQQSNSITAIGSGQLAGKGLSNNEVSTSNKGNFVAELQNDFIFAVAGEELGFIGCAFIVFLLLFIVYECIKTGRIAKDVSGVLVCTGIASLVAVQSFINICVATGLFPNTGTPLPFVSYGLTSLLSMYIGMGIVLNIGLQNKNYYIYETNQVKRRRISRFRTVLQRFNS